jgi:hypothetical protein
MCFLGLRPDRNLRMRDSLWDGRQLDRAGGAATGGGQDQAGQLGGGQLQGHRQAPAQGRDSRRQV